jgi:hypothetical protein
MQVWLWGFGGRHRAENRRIFIALFNCTFHILGNAELPLTLSTSWTRIPFQASEWDSFAHSEQLLLALY